MRRVEDGAGSLIGGWLVFINGIEKFGPDCKGVAGCTLCQPPKPEPTLTNPLALALVLALAVPLTRTLDVGQRGR